MINFSALSHDIDPLLSKASVILESTFSLDLEGHDAIGDTITYFQVLLTHYEGIVSIEIDNDQATLQDLTDLSNTFSPFDWIVHVGKKEFSDAVPDENRIVFFTKKGFLEWCEQLDPLRNANPLLERRTIIAIAGLTTPFGGPQLTICDLSLPPSKLSTERKPQLPDSRQIHGLIHTIADQVLKVNPRQFELSWGEIDCELAQPIQRLFAAQLAACLAQDVFVKDKNLYAILRGTKRLELPLLPGKSIIINSDKINQLANAVAWVYEERAETRHRLLSDRLSIDIDLNSSLLEGLFDNISEALKQAKERYGFVVMERKDAYYKELRDLLKDLRVQADLYATKVRDLVSSLFRDTLAVLVLIGFTLLPKINVTNLTATPFSKEVEIFFRILAGYFIVSFTLQAVSNTRDLSLSWQESNHWLTLIRDYTSPQELEDNFKKPLKRRRMTFWVALLISGICYALLAIATWNFTEVVSWLVSLVSATGQG